MQRTRVTTADEWAAAWRKAEPYRAVEAALATAHRVDATWSLTGWCDVCRGATAFACDWHGADQDRPNYRERLLCPGCSLNTRQRAVLGLLRETLAERPAPARVYAYEQVTPFYRALVAHFPDAVVVGSEYLGAAYEPGVYRDGLRHEDALRMSFADASFDVLLSNDVYEHVPDIDRALAEAARVLAPGGALIATVPFAGLPASRARAIVRDGEVVELLPAQYHGNPLSPRGSLVFHDFGWDLLDRCRAAGFDDACFLHQASLLRGYLSCGPLLYARKTDAAPLPSVGP